MSAGPFEVQTGQSIDRDTLVLPEVVIQDLSSKAKDILKPILDLVWNACGYPCSLNFDSNGNWIKRGTQIG
jgi:hypothetical protein